MDAKNLGKILDTAKQIGAAVIAGNEAESQTSSSRNSLGKIIGVAKQLGEAAVSGNATESQPESSGSSLGKIIGAAKQIGEAAIAGKGGESRIASAGIKAAAAFVPLAKPAIAKAMETIKSKNAPPSESN
jgi:hypothetical protein